VVSFYATKVWFLLTVRNALLACHPSNRRMNPNKVWLELIPVFGYFWHFSVIHAVADSLRAEYRDRDIDDAGPFGERIGWRAQIYLPLLAVPGVNVVAGILFAVFAISYWVLVAHHARTLRRHDERRAVYRRVLRAALCG
jgi:hypothetical protein